MSNTASARVRISRKATLTKHASKGASTMITVQSKNPILQPNCIVVQVGRPSKYVSVNFETQKRQNAYRKINNLLGE